VARKNQRKFSGMVYMLYKLTPQKVYAKAMQKTLKRQGFLSRVTKEDKDKYAVWYRKDTRSK